MADAAQEPRDPQPRLRGDSFDCPRCGRFAKQTWEQLCAFPPGRGQRSVEDSDAVDVSNTELWFSSRCDHCEQPSIWRGEILIYPSGRRGPQPHAQMPHDIRLLYDEASFVANISPRAGAALARATVERLIKVLDSDAPKGANLEKRIDRIKQRGISSSLSAMLDVVRYVGNKMLHVDEQPGELIVLALDDKEGPQLLGLLLETANDLVDEFIAKPAAARTYWDKLPESIRNKLPAQPIEATIEIDEP